MHLAAPLFHDVPVTQLVQRLDEGIGHRKQPEALRRQDPVGDVLREFGPMHARQHEPISRDGEKQDRAEPGNERPGQGHRGRQKVVGIQKRQAYRHRVEDAHDQLPAALFAGAVRRLPGIRRHVSVQDVALVQLGEKADDFFLGQDVVTQFGACAVPDLLDRAPAVHQANDQVGGRREAMEASRRPIVQHVPKLSPEVLPENAHMAPQPRPQVRHPIPGRTVEGAVGRHG